jgi:hypothetical protein
MRNSAQAPEPSFSRRLGSRGRAQAQGANRASHAKSRGVPGALAAVGATWREPVAERIRAVCKKCRGGRYRSESCDRPKIMQAKKWINHNCAQSIRSSAESENKKWPMTCLCELNRQNPKRFHHPDELEQRGSKEIIRLVIREDKPSLIGARSKIGLRLRMPGIIAFGGHSNRIRRHASERNRQIYLTTKKVTNQSAVSFRSPSA